MHDLTKKLLAILIMTGATSFSYSSGLFHTVIPSNKKVLVASAINSIDYAPTFTNCPSDINNVMPDPGNCTAIVSWTPPTASGSGPVTMTSNYNPGDSFYPGTHRVIYRATDSSGDTSFCEFRVTVLDNQAPIITVPANINRSADPGSCGAVVTFPYPTASDNCPAGDGAPIDESFDSGTDLSTECYDFDGTFVGNSGNINGSAGELETVELINNDIRSFTSPLTQFNGTGEIFFDHRIIAGSPSNNIGNNARLTVKLITTGGVETIIYNELYVDENVQTEYIPISQNGNYYVQFEWETDQNRNDIAYLDDLYIPGYVVSDTTVVTCGVAAHRVVQIAGQPYRSGREFPVGTTTLEYLTRDAAGNVGFNSFKVTVTNNITPPNGDDVEYCEGNPVPTLTVTVGSGQTVDWYDAAVGGTLLLAGNTSYQPPGPGNYYAETRNVVTGCVSSTRRRIRVTENPQPDPPSAPSPVEYCINDTATPLTATGDSGNMIFWYDAAIGGNMYPNAPTPDTSTAQTTFYYVEQVDATTGCISNRTEVAVTVYSLPLAPTVVTPVEYCIGDISDELDNSVTSGSNLRWYDAASGGNEIPGTTRPDTSAEGQQFFWVTQSATSGSTDCESTRTLLTVNVNMPPAITMQPIDRSVCENENTTFAVGTSDAAAFQWQIFDGTSWNDLSDTATYSNTGTNTMTITGATLSLNGNRYRVVGSSLAASCADAISDSATLTVNTAPPAPTSGGDQTECEQNPVQTLTATATPPSGAAVVWYDSASGGNIVANPILDAVGTVTYYAESNDSGNSCPSVGRTPVTLTVQAAPTAPVSGGDQTECEQSPIQTLTATATAPTGSTIVWYDAASGGNTVASPTLNSVGNVIYYAQGNDNGTGCPSTSRTAVALTIQPAPALPVSGGDQTECESSPTQTLTATATVPSGFTVTWYDAAFGGNTVADPDLNSVGTITYYAESTSDATTCQSISRTSVTLTIEALPAAPASGGDQTECEADPTQTMIATATASSGATVDWYDAASGGNSVANPILNSIGTVTYFAESRTTSSGCTSNSRTPVTLTMNPRPTITVTPASQSCSPDLSMYSVSVDVDRGTVTSSEGTVTDNGGNNWTVSGITSGNNITVTVTDVNSCSENIAINAPNCACPTVSAPTSGGDQTECETDPIQTLTATATPPAGASVVWYDAATNGKSVASPNWNTVGTITYFAESVENVNSCTSSTRTPVTLTIQGAPTAPVSGGDQTECRTTPTQTLTATATSAAGTNIVWYDAASGGNTVANPILDTVGTIIYYAESNDNSSSCTSLNRTAVTLTIHALPNVVANATSTNINAGEPVTLNGSGANTYIWDNGINDGDTVFPITTTTYTVIGTDGNGCENTDSVTTIVGATSDIRMEKTVDIANPNVGDSITFTLTATNDGPNDDTGGSIVQDVLPIGFSYAGDNGNAANGTYDAASGNWILPALVNGSSVALEIMATVNAPTGAVDEYQNVAEIIAATNYDNDSAPNNDDGDQSEDDEDAVLITPQFADLSVSNAILPTNANPGDTVIITVDVRNDGVNDATNVALENFVPSGFTITTVNNNGTITGDMIIWSGLNIPIGTVTTLTYEATINIPTNTPGEYLNTVQVTQVDQFDPDSAPNNDDGDQSEDDEDNSEIVLIPADLSLTKTLSAGSDQNPNAGDTVVFELTLTNSGPGLATNVSVEDRIPSGFTVGSIGNGGSPNGNNITWSVPSLAVASETFTYEVTINVPTNVLGEYTNTAQVTTSDQFDPDSTPNNDDGDQNEDDEARYTIGAPTVDIEIAKSVDKSRTFQGDTVVFTVTATNNSSYDASNVGIEDVLPAGYILVSHTADSGAYNETTATWEIASIAVGETSTLEMTVTVTEIEDYTNIAQLIYVDQIDPNIDNDRAEVTPEVTQAECLTVFNEFSPNDDGANDVFFIECIENYPNNVLRVYNRWGNEVFAAMGYDNSWDGTMTKGASIGSSDKLPVGTYYYILQAGQEDVPAKTGWLYISR